MAEFSYLHAGIQCQNSPFRTVKFYYMDSAATGTDMPTVEGSI